MQTIVMFPDFKGEAMLAQRQAGGFVDRVRKAVPDAVLVPVLNGLSPPELDHIAIQVREFDVVSTMSIGPRKLLDALVRGYEFVSSTASECHIVRLDTAEHLPEEIPRLLAEVPAGGMLIGDLDFTDGHLVPGTVDEFAHLDLFPELYRQTTGGRMALSCSHGFQVFSNIRACEEVVRVALKIVAEAERNLKQPVTWGFDGAMALSANMVLANPKVVKVKSETTRDRPRDKVAAQFAGALHICRAFGRLYPWVGQ